MSFNHILRGMLLTLPIMIGIIPLGIIFGAQAVQAGFEPLAAIFMPAINFAGGHSFMEHYSADFAYHPNDISY